MNAQGDVQGNAQEANNGLITLPALIDPHVHFRTPGHEYKENWISGAQAAIAGGVTTVFDMPNTQPPCTTYKRLVEKKALIDRQLQEAGIPLRYYLYIGVDEGSIAHLEKVKDEVIGIKIYMSSTSEQVLRDVFQTAADLDMLVGVHAECGDILQERKNIFLDCQDPSVHSRIHNHEAAVKATAQAIELAAATGVRLVIHHTSTREELSLIRQAKNDKLPVYAEATPQHLFLTQDAYKTLGTLVQMNPPMRTHADQEALWAAIGDGTVDFIGSDHAPHTLEEKRQPYGKAPSGIPGIETTLPLLLNAHSEGRISLDKIIQLTRTNIEKIYRLPSDENKNENENKDVVLVDLAMKKEVVSEDLKTKCGWSPFSGKTLCGWPVKTICQGVAYA